jgi:hypothetical protein
MQPCPNQEANTRQCTCDYEPCPRKGVCCQCIAYHRDQGQLPGCYGGYRLVRK